MTSLQSWSMKKFVKAMDDTLKCTTQRCSFVIFQPQCEHYSHSFMLHRHAQWGAFRTTRAKPLTFRSTWNTLRSVTRKQQTHGMVTEQGRTMIMPATQAHKCADSGICRCVNASEESKVYIHVLMTDCGTISLHENDGQTDINKW